jgi:hypothetical protein
LGLIVIAVTIFDTMSYFKAEQEFPQVFVIEEQATAASSGILDNLMSGMVSDQMNSLLGEGTIPKMLNMTAWSLFAFIMIFAGGKIADIGFKLVKN